MFTTGARISETLNITKDDTAGRKVHTITKTGPRLAYLTREMRLVVESLPDHGPLFTLASPRSVYNHLYGICNEAGIERLPPHQAGRHAFTTQMIVRKGVEQRPQPRSAGGNPPAISWTTTSIRRKLVEVLDKAFAPPKPSKKDKVQA